MRIVIEKAARRLTLLDGDQPLFSAPIALGSAPVGPKSRARDGRTPEGRYFVCLKKVGKFGPALGISYPNEADARTARADEGLIACIRDRAARRERPPWGTALGGEIYIHGGGTAGDWTAGCIALNDDAAASLYGLTPLGTDIQILP
ncbi:MAG: L,D-transpeptidase [Clostridia bacterium]|nr:L,D-transpeptidase [Clostridia bacterium]